MTTEHTPGPWTAFDPEGRWPDPIIIVSGSLSVSAAEPIDDHNEQVANARLIAAAPDLLAACKLAADCIGDVSLKQTILDAIAKAEPVPQSV